MLIAKPTTAIVVADAPTRIAVAIIVPAAYDGAAKAIRVTANASLLNPVFIFFSEAILFVFKIWACIYLRNCEVSNSPLFF